MYRQDSCIRCVDCICCFPSLATRFFWHGLHSINTMAPGEVTAGLFPLFLLSSVLWTRQLFKSSPARCAITLLHDDPTKLCWQRRGACRECRLSDPSYTREWPSCQSIENFSIFHPLTPRENLCSKSRVPSQPRQLS